MGSPDYREQFNHALSILEAAKVGYVHVMDGLGFGFHKLGESIVWYMHRAARSLVTRCRRALHAQGRAHGVQGRPHRQLRLHAGDC